MKKTKTQITVRLDYQPKDKTSKKQAIWEKFGCFTAEVREVSGRGINWGYSTLENRDFFVGDIVQDHYLLSCQRGPWSEPIYFKVAHSREESNQILYSLALKKATQLSIKYRTDLKNYVPNSVKGRKSK